MKTKNKSKPTISACLIVKNEEEFLPCCLKSVRNVVDEIIVVDTGSTDNTVNIAKDHCAKVYHHTWNDSFSEAKNYSISYATCDWILQIDADEELEQSDIPRLRDAIGDNRYNAILVAIYSNVKNNEHKFYYPRIFRRGNAYYRDIIHEQIIIEGAQLPTEIRLYHHGYNLNAIKMKKKWERTTYLLKKQLEQNDGNSFAWINLIRNYRSQELYEKGIETGEAALKRIKPEENFQHYRMICYETANCYLHKGNFKRAKELCYEKVLRNPISKIQEENIDILYTLACIHLKEGDYDVAIELFKQYLSLHMWYHDNLKSSHLLIDTLGYDYAAYNGLGYCYGNTGEWQLAMHSFKRAIAINPRYLTSYKNLSACQLIREKKSEAIATLSKTISAGIADHDVFLNLGELCMEQKAYQDAIKYFEDYLKKCPRDKKALLKISQCYELSGWLEAAHIGFRSVNT
ncbi:MAG: glycosyltransferase [Candidatus Brocadiaceae bacterium]